MVEIRKQDVEPLLEILDEWLTHHLRHKHLHSKSTIHFAECLKMQLEAPPPKEEICCDNCLIAVTDAAYESGIDILGVDDEMEDRYPDNYAKLLSRQIGADIPDHDCEQLDPEAAVYFEKRVCICGCHGPDFSYQGGI